MNIEELSVKLDSAIANYQTEAGAACQYCSDLSNGDALSASHKATVHALSTFKSEILAYLSQHQ